VELIERESAVRALQGALQQAGQGRGGTVLLFGEAGIGKTSLLKAVFDVAPAAHGCEAPHVLRGGCEALFSPRPLGPLHDMAHGLGERFRAALARERGQHEAFALAMAELRDMARVAVMIIEDVHWADEATLDFIKYLGRRIEASRLLLVLSYRDDELGERHPLRAVLGDLPAAGLCRIPLMPLSLEGVQRMSQQLVGGRADAPGACALHAATRGNPFFLTECLRDLSLPAADGTTPLTAAPATVRDAVLARAARQTAAVRSLLDLVAIVPARIETTLVQALLAPAPRDVAAALASGLLVADGPHLAFRHELARVALEQALPHPLAAEWHERVLAQLERQPDKALARLVHHARAAGNADAVLRHAPRAAEQAAAQGAHREAAALLAAALAHAQRLPDAERAALHERHAYECYLTDQIAEALRAREAALAIWQRCGEREREAHTLRWLSRLSWFQGRTDRAVTLAESALALHQALPPSVERAWATSNRAQLHMLMGEVAAAVERGGQAIALAEQLDAQEVQVHALNNVGAALYVDESATPAARERGREALERSLALAHAHPWPEHVSRAYVNLASVAITLRDYASARRWAEEAKAYFSAHDLDSWAHYLAAWVCRMDFEQGDWSAAAAAAQTLLRSDRVAPISRVPALAVLAQLRLRRGDPGLWPTLAEATELARSTGEIQRLAPVAAVHAEAAWLGHTQADLTLVHEVYRLAEQHHSARALGELGFWLHRLGQAPNSVPGSLLEPAHAAQCDGRWRESAALWSALGCRFERAMALHGSGDEAAMHEALADMLALDAPATAERMREAMRQQGVKGISRGPRATTAAHPAGLTHREAQILMLIAQGLTNAEIAAQLARSAKTVDHHVSAILGKLNARTRAEASAMAARLGLLGGETAGSHQPR
jgi:DNA-binding CsgD family transcriptional regulator/tetratricopeptide (TPR) repeat protein